MVAAGEHHGRCRRPRLRVGAESAEHRIAGAERREHAHRGAGVLANERRACKPGHDLAPCIAGDVERGGQQYAPDASVGMVVPDGGQGRDADAALAAVAHELGDERGVEPRHARRVPDGVAHHRGDLDRAGRFEAERPVARVSERERRRAHRRRLEGAGVGDGPHRRLGRARHGVGADARAVGAVRRLEGIERPGPGHAQAAPCGGCGGVAYPWRRRWRLRMQHGPRAGEVDAEPERGDAPGDARERPEVFGRLGRCAPVVGDRALDAARSAGAPCERPGGLATGERRLAPRVRG